MAIIKCQKTWMFFAKRHREVLAAALLWPIIYYIKRFSSYLDVTPASLVGGLTYKLSSCWHAWSVCGTALMLSKPKLCSNDSLSEYQVALSSLSVKLYSP